MNTDSSPFEGILDRLGGKISLGQVIQVNQNADGSYDRTVRVKTLGNQEHGTDDQDLPNVKVLHMQWNTDGSYAVSMPLVGSYYMVGYINSEPILLGAYPLSITTNPTAAADQAASQASINPDGLGPGDYAFVTAQGSRVIIRSGGTVEIESTKNCRTYWLPTRDTITTVCRNNELYTAAGHETWTIDPDTGDCLTTTQIFDNDIPTTVVQTQVGTNPTGDVLNVQIGEPDANLNIASPTFQASVRSDGTTLITAAGAKTKYADSTIAIGTDSVELLKQISDFLDKTATWAGSVGATHTHIGNLGAPTSPPVEAADYIQLQVDLLTIKQLVDSIRGTF